MKEAEARSVPDDITPAEVMPHGGAMLLLDQVLDCRDAQIIAAATIRRSSLFLNDEGMIPAWIGLEYMAQSIAAWAGINAKKRGRPVEAGYLIAARSYQATGQGFIVGDRLEVTANRLRYEGPLAVFECTIDSEHCGARGTVTVYRSPVFSGQVQIGD